MKEKAIEVHDKNVGISILRIICTYLVVRLHSRANWISGEAATELECISVPCFMFLSFYLCNSIFYERNPQILKKRIVRLVAPLFFWNVVCYLLYMLVDCRIIHWRQLIFGVLFGHATELNCPLWYLVTQLFIIVIVFVIYYIFDNNEKAEKVIIGVFICGIGLQYTGVNFYLFRSCVDEVICTFGFCCELLPMAITGMLWGRVENIFEERKKKIIVVLVAIVACIVFRYIPAPEGFG